MLDRRALSPGGLYPDKPVRRNFLAQNGSMGLIRAPKESKLGEGISRGVECCMSRQEPLIFVVSGETSGDNLAGRKPSLRGVDVR